MSGDIFDNIKRIKAFEKILLGFSNNKFIIKDLEKPEEHRTMVFKENGIVDIHNTKEGSQKEYEPFGKFDLIKSVQKIVSDPSIFMDGIKALVDSAKEVTFDEPEFVDYKIVNFVTKEELLPIIKKKKKDVIIPIESAEEFFSFKNMIRWNDAKGKIKEKAWVLNKEDVPIGFLVNIQERILLFSIDIMKNPFFSNLISIMTTPEKADQEKHNDTQGKD